MAAFDAKEPRKGSMAAADAKNQKIGLIVFSAVFAVIYLLWIVPSNLFSHYYFSQAGMLWKVLGFASIGVHYWFLWKKFRGISTGEGDKFTSNGLLIGWFLLNIFLLSGWTFNLPE